MPEIVAEPEEKKEEHRQMGSMSLLQHLEELRKRLIYSLAAVAVGACVGWWFAQDKIYPLMAKPLIDVYKKYGITTQNGLPQLSFLNPLTPFNTYLKVGLVAGIFLACPVVLYQIWMFISPGLYRREKRFILPFLFLSVGLFLSGGYFGYRVVFPIAMDFLIGTYGKGLAANVTIDEYTKVFLTMILGLAIIFELPIVIGFAAMMGVVNAKFLIKHIRGAVLGFFIIAAVLSPTTDILNMMIYAAPMIFLYILSIGIAWLVHPKQRRKRAEKREAGPDRE
ncbi:MAG TPA: twin-arginine translocase subunit TatC [Verrucomicrobiae bacterium]|jgi:sec-independent protein translocase protein TatC|nr:twin-arginine translocase subunit TatC [Verrucomicrobiae bacterium]